MMDRNISPESTPVEDPDELIPVTTDLNDQPEAADDSGITDPYAEISVLDYLKFKLNPKNFGKEIMPEENPSAYDGTDDGTEPTATEKSPFFAKVLDGRELVKTRINPLFLALSLCFALTAQIILEPAIMARTRMTPWIGSGFYLLSALSFLFSFLLRKPQEESDPGSGIEDQGLRFED